MGSKSSGSKEKVPVKLSYQAGFGSNRPDRENDKSTAAAEVILPSDAKAAPRVAIVKFRKLLIIARFFRCEAVGIYTASTTSPPKLKSW